ncbi:putative enzyme [Syntrophobacter sp. SbD1]|nr:putative enzyme [Syntrophobacter sp. SbD1]
MKRILFVSAINHLHHVENRYGPLWPAYLASYVEENLGKGFFEYLYANHAVEDKIRNYKPDLVAISSVTQNFNYAIRYAGIAKKYGLPVIVGGTHITSLPSCLAKEMDVACMGEGEETFLELMRHFLESSSFAADKLPSILGIAFHENGQVRVTAPRTLHNSIDRLPHPKRSIIGYGRRTYLYTARGCPDRCVFCGASRHWGKVRYASTPYILEEIEELIEHGVKVIRFADENFVANKPRLRELAKEIRARGINTRVKFSCWCRSSTVDAETAELLKSMNVVSAKLGLESGSSRILSYLKGKVTVEQNRNGVELLKKAGLQVNADFIIASPDETKEEILQTYEFIKRTPLDFVEINILSPLPGTPIWEYSLSKNLVSDAMDWSRLNFKFNKDPGTAIVLSETLGHSEIAKLHRKFQWLRLLKAFKAVWTSPWLAESPMLVLRRVIQRVKRRALKMEY